MPSTTVDDVPPRRCVSFASIRSHGALFHFTSTSAVDLARSRCGPLNRRWHRDLIRTHLLPAHPSKTPAHVPVPHHTLPYQQPYICKSSSQNLLTSPSLHPPSVPRESCRMSQSYEASYPIRIPTQSAFVTTTLTPRPLKREVLLGFLPNMKTG